MVTVTLLVPNAAAKPVAFAISKKSAEEISLEDKTLVIISYDGLLLNKIAVNHHIDKSDIDELVKLDGS